MKIVTRKSIGWFIFLAILVLIGVAIIKAIFEILFSYSDIILSITALILVWYTYETHVIAEANEENQKYFRKPTINYRIYRHDTDKLETMLGIENSSNHPVAVRLNCNFKIDGEALSEFTDYSGGTYWNLQYKEGKTGHFSFLTLLLNKGTLSIEVFNEIKNAPITDPDDRYNYAVAKLYELIGPTLPSITMDVEIYCQNEMDVSYYPPVHYDYDYLRKRWIPKITSTKPYWEYDSKPEWTKLPPTVDTN
jgi:hypothetical protein